VRHSGSCLGRRWAAELTSGGAVTEKAACWDRYGGGETRERQSSELRLSVQSSRCQSPDARLAVPVPPYKLHSPDVTRNTTQPRDLIGRLHQPARGPEQLPLSDVLGPSAATPCRSCSNHSTRKPFRYVINKCTARAAFEPVAAARWLRSEEALLRAPVCQCRRGVLARPLARTAGHRVWAHAATNPLCVHRPPWLA